MANIFRFKQFSVDQAGCAMKINTDGVLLGALTAADKPLSILDIGTGTGVIALMLAQRFANAHIDACEIDESTATTAASNFKNSPFADRLTLHPSGFEAFFDAYPERKYDLIVSNPPFYINSLQSPGVKKNLAKHAGARFFDELMLGISDHLATDGVCWLILPVGTAAMVKNLAVQHRLYLQKTISICSFKDDEPHREILAFGFGADGADEERLVIYDGLKVYSKGYQEILKEFLTIF
ncbi:tRNA1(Val) (adenine(37)-N6)-methyltransferase [Mucilaginibacter pocheonensis]|uniref:tRNA1(Val) (adenine(37)-N6)-methyltransferase n=1 Tax=Mucilaginibacter pocheonensis TaxID=398050 RepID=A0ABU1T630_9SPHI|nr:methyltransferase [Mucilaginibacter pocheonensis]MDR6940833.1 tRNA1Val (adenine37-N6)-methyltransferase [Mucilaginibacter pocheonensis]